MLAVDLRVFCVPADLPFNARLLCYLQGTTDESASERSPNHVVFSVGQVKLEQKMLRGSCCNVTKLTEQRGAWPCSWSGVDLARNKLKPLVYLPLRHSHEHKLLQHKTFATTGGAQVALTLLTAWSMSCPYARNLREASLQLLWPPSTSHLAASQELHLLPQGTSNPVKDKKGQQSAVDRLGT